MSTIPPAEARKLVAKLKQPDGMRRPTWKRVQQLLRQLCRYLPDPYPGIRRLAHDTNITVPTVARLLTRAEELGLIARAPRTVPGHLDGYTYRLTFLDAVPVSTPVSTSAQVETEEEDLRSSLFTTFRENPFRGRFASPAARRPNKYTGRCHVCTEIVWPGEGYLHGPLPVHQGCEVRGEWEREQARDMHGSPAFGEDPEAPLPSASTRPSKPQARLAKHFEERWNTDALVIHPEWRGQYRGIELGAAIGYLRRTFLDAGYNVEHVTLMIDAFFEDLINPHCTLEIKEGQTAFQLFTGWWGRNPIPDPVIERERQAAHDRLVAQARSQMDASRNREKEAWARIDVAMEAGEQPDPDDLRVVGMPVPRRQPTSIHLSE